VEHIQTPQSTTIAHKMAYTEHLVIELSDPDFRKDALVHSKVLLIYHLFFCPFLMSSIGFTINQNLKGVVISFTMI